MGKKDKLAAAVTTMVCVGNGGSLTLDDLAIVRDSGAPTIVINDVYKWAPWASILYAPDYRWWNNNWPDLARANWQGRFMTIDPDAAIDFRLELAHCEDLHVPMLGLNPNPDVLRHGYSGGFQAMEIARMLGARRIVLLGYDYGATGHSHAVPGFYHPTPSDYGTMITAFDAAADQLKKEGTEVINCTRESALTCFVRGDLERVLAAGRSE